MLHRISVDCGLPDSSSLVVRPALRFVVVGRATGRVLKGKSAGFHRWYNVTPGQGRIQVGLVENSPQGKNGVSLGFILCCWCNFGFWLFVFLQREGFLKLDEVLDLVLRPKW